MRIASIAAVAAALAVVVAYAGVGRPVAARGSSTQAGRTITVEGVGTARFAPDTATFSFGVDTQGATAQAATAANAEKMQQVIVALRKLGIAKADLQTQDISVYPHETNAGVPDGFSANSSLSATVRQLSKAGAAVDAAVAAGANETSGPQFDRSSRAELTRSALRDAFDNARAKAEALAQQSGAQLGEAQRIAESGQSEPAPMPVAYAADMARTPVKPGTEQVQESVTVTFSLA
jgi:uncharacterized protein YggE